MIRLTSTVLLLLMAFCCSANQLLSTLPLISANSPATENVYSPFCLTVTAPDMPMVGKTFVADLSSKLFLNFVNLDNKKCKTSIQVILQKPLPNQSLKDHPILLRQGYHIKISKNPNSPHDFIIKISELIHNPNHDGAFYATRTVLQLLKVANTSGSLPLIDVDDIPITQERSLMIDVARHYFTLTTLKNFMRQMSYYKMNMLHLHFTDWSAFRLNSEKYPGLADPNASYNQNDITKVLLPFAEKYHITIVPEIDLPAHASALTAYFNKTLGKSIDFHDEINQGICLKMNYINSTMHHDGFTLNIFKDDTMRIVEELLFHFKEWFINANLPNQGKYFSIGADEYPSNVNMNNCMLGMHNIYLNNLKNNKFKYYNKWWSYCFKKETGGPCRDVNQSFKPDSTYINPGDYRVVPGGYFVENFINKIYKDLFRDAGDTMRMRIWAGWDAAFRLNQPKKTTPPTEPTDQSIPPECGTSGTPACHYYKSTVKYSSSNKIPKRDIAIDSWLIGKNLNELVKSGHSVANASYQLTYLTPGFAFENWDFPPPEKFLISDWQPNVYELQNGGPNHGGLQQAIKNKYSPNFLGAGLNLWTDTEDESIQKTDEYYYTLTLRPLKIIANKTWSGLAIDKNKPAEQQLQLFINLDNAIGSPPGLTLPPCYSYELSHSMLTTFTGKNTSCQKAPLTKLYAMKDLPTPWRTKFTLNSLQDNTLFESVINHLPKQANRIYLHNSKLSYTNGVKKIDSEQAIQSNEHTVGTFNFNLTLSINHQYTLTGTQSGIMLKDLDTGKTESITSVMPLPVEKISTDYFSSLIVYNKNLAK